MTSRPKPKNTEDVTLKLSPTMARHYDKHLGQLRCWIDGYRQGSKLQGPYDADILRSLQVAISDALARK